MKGGGGGGGGKRRWRVLVVGVLVLIILSTLVPLAFLLGLHNGFHSPGNFHSLSISVFRSDSLLSLILQDSSLFNRLLL